MTAPARRVHVVHAPDGRVLAVAPAAEHGRDGVQTGLRPVPAADQRACEVELTPAQAALPLVELLELEVRVDPASGRAALRPRGAPRRS